MHYWQQTAANWSDDVPADLIKVDPDQNYFLEFAGERLLGNEDLDPAAFLDSLYTTLVEEEPEKEALSVVQLSESLLSYLDLMDRVQKNFRLELPLNETIKDSVVFDYRFDNGRPNLMRAVTLTYSDDRSWDNIHSAAWDLQQAQKFPVDDNQQTVTLVKTRPADVALQRQMAVLGTQADAVIDVGDDVAPDRLAATLGLNGNPT